jgi:hypothetical protein
MGASELPRSLGDPVTPSRKTLAWGLPSRKAPGSKPASGLCGSENRRTGWYGQINQKEVRSEGSSGVGASHST